MIKYLICLLFPLLLAAQPLATTRISERQVRGLTADLDTLNAAMGSITNGYVSQAYAGQFATNFTENYVMSFLPGLMYTYTYAFRTNELKFADGTLTTFGSIVTPGLHVYNDVHAASLRTTDTNYVGVGFYAGTYNLDTAKVSSAALYGDVAVSNMFSRTLNMAGSTVQSTGTVATTLSEGGGFMYTTNNVAITGDVYIRSRASSRDVYRHPILYCDTGSGGNWYNPLYAVPSGSGSVLVTDSLPVEYRVAPVSPAAGYHSILSVWGPESPVFGTGPHSMFMYPPASGRGMVDTDAGSAGPYLLEAYLLPAVDASIGFLIGMRHDPWVAPPMPPWPDLPDPEEPWIPPPLPTLSTPSVHGKPKPGTARKSHTALFYDTTDDVGSMNVEAPPTVNTAGWYEDTYGPSAWGAQAATDARNWWEPGVTSGAHPWIGPTDYFNYHWEKRVFGPKDVLTDVKISPQAVFGNETVTTTYERQLFTCWRKSTLGSYFGLTKYSQKVTITESKQVSMNFLYTFGWAVRPAWAGSHIRSQAVGPVVETSVTEQDLPAGARGVGGTAEMFHFIGDTAYASNDSGATYRTGFSTNTVDEEYLTLYLVTNGTSLYNPGVPDYLARQWIYEPVGGTNRAPRDMEMLYASGDWLLWRERNLLFVQKSGESVLRFLRTYDGNDTPALDISNTNFPFVVDSVGNPGESGFGNPAVAVIMSTSHAEELVSVDAERDEDTSAVSYTVYVRKRRPR